MAGTVDEIINEAYGVPAAPESASASDTADDSSEGADDAEPLLQSTLGLDVEDTRARLPPFTDTYDRYVEESEIDRDAITFLAALARAALALAG